MNKNALIGYALAALSAAGGLAAFIHKQREIGALTVLNAQVTAHRDSVVKALAVKEVRFVRDTIRLTKRVERWDSVNALTGALDSARAALYRAMNTPTAKPETVTVRVTASSVLQADSTIKACVETLRSCADIQRDLRSIIRDDTVRIRNLQSRVPSTAKKTVERVAIAYVSIQTGCLLASGRLCLALSVPR